MSRVDELRAAVPIAVHKVRFETVRIFGLRAICACGWSAADGGTQSDRVYWLARAHFDDMRALRDEGTP